MSLRVVFMGTPEFAVASLRAIYESDHEVVGVVTVADKPAGRGRKLRPSAVKSYAAEHKLPLLQPHKLKDPDFLGALEAWKADLIVVVAFRMLPKEVWELPPLGTINLHGSLLPQYRGAAPIHRAVMDGCTTTGCTTFFINEVIDTGAILLQHEIPIGANDTTGDVHDRMMLEGAELLVKTLDGLEAGTLESTPQDAIAEEDLRPAPKIFKEDCLIDWTRPAQEIHNFIRGLSPFPAAWTFERSDKNKTYKFLRSQVTGTCTQHAPGTVIQTSKGLEVVCGDQEHVAILELQPSGKKRMSTADFVRGYDLNGVVLGD